MISSRIWICQIDFFFKDLSNKTSFVEIRWKTAKIWSIWRKFWFHEIFVNIAIWRKSHFTEFLLSLTAIWQKFDFTEFKKNLANCCNSKKLSKSHLKYYIWPFQIEFFTTSFLTRPHLSRSVEKQLNYGQF